MHESFIHVFNANENDSFEKDASQKIALSNVLFFNDHISRMECVYKTAKKIE